MTDESRDIDYEKILKLDSTAQEEFVLSTPPSVFLTPLHVYQQQALTWMLMREGKKEDLKKAIGKTTRGLHPFWEEYLVG